MKFKLRPIFKDISLTFITQAIVLAGFFLIYRLIAKNLGPEGVGEYSLVKRVIGFLQPLLLLGLGVGIPRYIAMSQNKNQGGEYIKVGGSIVATFAFIFLVFINLFKYNFSKVFFGSTDYTNLVLPFSFFLAGLILYNLLYSYFRGRLFVKTFNFFQIINLVLIPVVILLVFGKATIEGIIFYIGICTFIISLIFFSFFGMGVFAAIGKLQIKRRVKELLKYSLPRVPGDFILGGLLSLGPIFAAHFSSMREVGYLSVGQSLLGIMATVVAPLGLILLPKVSSLVASGKRKIIEENLNVLIGAIIQCSIFVSIQLIIFTDVIIKYWLGSDFIDSVPIMRILFFSIIFYTFYVAMRSILDAVRVKPLNTINLLISLVVFLFLTGTFLFLANLVPPIIGLSIAFSFGLVCLGLLTYISLRKIFNTGVKKDLNCFWITVGINILFGGLAMLMKPAVAMNLYYFVIFEILLGITYLSVLWLLRMEWIRQIPEKVLLG
ncbi:MAG: oligosaccharide flippase family protein [Candidatus Lokiarchaeia archaeon]